MKAFYLFPKGEHGNKKKDKMPNQISKTEAQYHLKKNKIKFIIKLCKKKKLQIWTKNYNKLIVHIEN